MATGAALPRGVVRAFPHRVRGALADDGGAFARGASAKWDAMRHASDRVRDEHGIEHGLTERHRPWNDGRAERMGRTVEDATTKAPHYGTAEDLRAHALASSSACNPAKRLEAPRRRTPFRAVRDARRGDPSPFGVDPHHLIPGPHT